jgi:hypothetical protein
MKKLFAILLLCLASGHAMADYSLPGVKERLVLLLDLKEIKLDKRGLILAVDNVEHAFTVDRFWMQDRIWSDGICVGVQDSDPKSSASRIREVQLALSKNKDSLLLVELVCVEETSHFIVTYLKLFNPEEEHKRYFPKRTYYDTIELPFDTKPKDSKSFIEELNQATEKSKKIIGKLKDPTTKSTLSSEGAPSDER